MKPIVQKVVAAGVLIVNNKALIIQRASSDDTYPNLWEIPSGKKDNFEQIKDAVIREFKEEAGIIVEVIRPVDVFNFVVEKEKETRDATQISFLVKTLDNPKVTLSSEHQKFAWITESELDKYNLSNETKQVLHEAFKL